jgi:hypothetical protein
VLVFMFVRGLGRWLGTTALRGLPGQEAGGRRGAAQEETSASRLRFHALHLAKGDRL